MPKTRTCYGNAVDDDERPVMHPLLLDLEGAATAIATQPDTLRRRAISGQVPGTRVGGQWRFWAPAILDVVVGHEAADHVTQQVPATHVEPGVVDLAQLADLLGLQSRTVHALVRSGAIPAKKSGQWRAYWPVIRDRIAAGLPLRDTPAGDRHDHIDDGMT